MDVLKHKPDLKKLTSEMNKKRLDEVEIMNQMVGSLTGYDCKICRNKGVVYVRDNVTDEVLCKKCSCIKKRSTYWRMQKSGIESLFDRYQLVNFKVTEEYQRLIKNTAISYIDSKIHKTADSPFFFIGGQSGSGKTHICTAIAGQLILHGYQARYFLWRDESTEIKAIANTPDYTKRVGELKKASLLYIDDLFKTQSGKLPTSGDIHLAFEIINYRYINYLPTIISSEMLLTQIIEVDQAIGGRIKELANGFIINISRDNRKNYRLK